MARKVLTATAVERLRPPRAGRAEHWDAALPGFGLRITENGSRSWVVMVRIRGRLVRLTLGRPPALGLAKARDMAREGIRLAAEGQDPRDRWRARKLKVAEGSFGAIAARFLEDPKTVCKRAFVETKRIVEKELLPRWEAAPIEQITRREVAGLVDAIVRRGVPIMANRTLGVISRIFSFGIGKGLVEAHPCTGMQRPAEERSRERIYSDEELKRLWAAWEQVAYPFGPLFELLLVTAQRRGEAATMAWPLVDLVRGLWTLPTTKAGHGHEVPLSPLAIEILSGPPRNGAGLVFTTTGESIVSGFSKAVRRARKLSGVTDFRPHDLRRTAGTGMARLGIPKITISRVLNHAEGGVTDIYVRHFYLEEKRSALNQWARKLREILDAPALSKEELHET